MLIYEKDETILAYLISRQILKQYLKQKRQIALGNFQGATFKKRRPFEKEMFYFRINNKYRAIGRFKEDYFVVTEISDHQ